MSVSTVVTLGEIRAYALDEAYRASLMADALKSDQGLRQAGLANEKRARMWSAVAALCFALISQDRGTLRGMVQDGIRV